MFDVWYYSLKILLLSSYSILEDRFVFSIVVNCPLELNEMVSIKVINESGNISNDDRNSLYIKQSSFNANLYTVTEAGFTLFKS